MGEFRLGKYRISSRIARGGMAEIFLATAHGPEGFAKTAVIKRLLPHLAERPEIVSMFLEEARIAAGLHHPHIVQIFDLGQDGEDHFICMEYLAGKDLAAMVSRSRDLQRPIPLEIVAQIGSCVAQGLQYAHDHRDADGTPCEVIHGDISPSNVVVTFVGEVKLVDFGIARAANAIQIAFPGAIKGKLAYLPPEQLAQGQSDRRADIYALGVVLHELLVGERLFKRDTEEATRRAITDERVPDPRERRPEVPETLAAAVMRALERDPGKRQQTADELRAGLDVFLAEQGFMPSSTSLAAYLTDLFGDEHARCVLHPAIDEATGTVTTAGPALEPVPDVAGLNVPAVPLIAVPSTRGAARGKPLVRVVGEAPAALFKAGQHLVAVPANALCSAMRWTRGRLIGLAAVFAVVGFGAGLLTREAHELATRKAAAAEERAPRAAPLLAALAPAPALEAVAAPVDEEDPPDASEPTTEAAAPAPARPAGTAPAAPSKHHGRLEMRGHGVVYVRGAPVGRAPLRKTLSPGTYDVTLIDDSGSVRGTWIAVVRPGMTTRLEAGR